NPEVMKIVAELTKIPEVLKVVVELTKNPEVLKTVAELVKNPEALKTVAKLTENPEVLKTFEREYEERTVHAKGGDARGVEPGAKTDAAKDTGGDQSPEPKSKKNPDGSVTTVDSETGKEAFGVRHDVPKTSSYTERTNPDGSVTTVDSETGKEAFGVRHD